MRDKINPIDTYLLELTGPLDASFQEVERQLKRDDLFGINIGVTEGVILAFFVAAFQVKSVLEIGTQYGYSTKWFLKNLPQDGTLITLEKNEGHFRQASENLNDPRCTIMCGDAKSILSGQLAQKKFDLIFIDANKKAYPDYLRYAKDHVTSGGLIIGDNTFMKNSVFSDAGETKVDPQLTEAMRLFNREMFSDSRFVSCIFPTTEGLTVAYLQPN